jgi:hypothetical protein
MTGKKSKNIDPLYQLFEHYLVTRSYEDTAAFTKQLAEQYLAYLDSTPAHVPFTARTGVLEDLATEAHEMLVKKMFGCVRVSDYVNYGTVVKVSRDKRGLGTCDFTEPPPLPAEQNTSNK